MQTKVFSRYVYYNGECVGELRFIKSDLVQDVVEVHNDMYKWSPAIAKESLILWNSILKYLKIAGIKKVVTEAPKDIDHTKLIKYWNFFGIRESLVEHNEQTILYGELEI